MFAPASFLTTVLGQVFVVLVMIICTAVIIKRLTARLLDILEISMSNSNTNTATTKRETAAIRIETRLENDERSNLAPPQ